LPDSNSDKMNRAEIEDQLNGLTIDDRLRLGESSRFLSLKCRIEPDDLLQEAVLKVLSGERTIPRNVKFAVGLVNVMRSLASNDRKSWKRQGDGNRTPTTVDADEYAGTIREDKPLQDVALESQEELDGILLQLEADLEGDTHEEAILIGRMCSLSKQEIMDSDGMSELEFEAARKRFARKTLRLKEERIG
jgi:DNA-directed RNA polymerase specialized sigma24 family protein